MAKLKEATEGEAPAKKQVSIPTGLVDRLEAEAKRRDVSVAYLVGRAIERALPALEAVDLDAAFPPLAQVPSA